MSPHAARASSLVLVGGFGAALLFRAGLPVWAAMLGWASYLDARDAPGALTTTVVGAAIGVVVAWAAEVAVFSIPVPPDSWLWIPRSAGAIALSLPLLVLASHLGLLARLSTALYGYAGIFAAVLMPLDALTSIQRLTGLHLYNPLFYLTISMAVGALAGSAAGRLERALGGSR